jgi:lipid A 3-O-deacylase
MGSRGQSTFKREKSPQPPFYKGGKPKSPRPPFFKGGKKNAALVMPCPIPLLPRISMLLMVIMLLTVPSLAGAGERKPKGTFGIFVDNDLFAFSDGGYTNGVDLAWLSPAIGEGGGRVPRWLDGISRGIGRRFGAGRGADSRRFVSLSLSQRMYTPEDITRRDLVEDDRPYAGVLTAGLGFHFRHGNHMDSFRFEAGIVGPHSYAGDIQKFLHRTFGWTSPEGWAHQLKDEPVLGLGYDHRRKLRAASGAAGIDWELIGQAGGDLSNLFTALGQGLEIRAGWNLPSDLGTSRIGPASDAAALLVDPAPSPAGPDRIGFHVFAALDVHEVIRDLLLDGNTFRSSHRVDKEPITADLSAGFALSYKRIKACLSYTYQSRRFRGQELKPLIGSLNLVALF